MSTVTEKSLQQWLDDLITAQPADRRMLTIDGLDAGIAYMRVICNRHSGQRLNWLSAFNHIDATEASYRLQHGAGARLHQPGDLVPAPAHEQPVRTPYPTVRCRSRKCGRPIIWAATASGSRMPVDANPDPAGNVLLSSPTSGDAPLATVLASEEARAAVPEDAVHTSHFATCPDAASWRRRS